MNLRDLLKMRKLNPGQAAEQMGVDPSVVYRWNRGDSRPEGDNLVKLLHWAAPHMTLGEALVKMPREEKSTEPAEAPAEPPAVAAPPAASDSEAPAEKVA